VVSVNRVLGEMFEAERNWVTVECRRPLNGELLGQYRQPNVIWVIKSRITNWWDIAYKFQGKRTMWVHPWLILISEYIVMY
jgi:hypothetical protein